MSSDMLSISIPSFADPSKYQLSKFPRPAVSEPTDVVIQVHAASINPIDVKKASGVFKAGLPEEYVTSPPFPLYRAYENEQVSI